MAVKLETQNLPDALIFHVKERFLSLRMLLETAACLAFGIVVFFQPLSVTTALFRVVAVVVQMYWISLLWQARQTGFVTDVRLTVSQTSIESDGVGRRAYTPSFFNRMWCDLIYDAGVAEDDPRPQGLYAGRSCLLPELNQEQTLEMIAAIYDRFPDTGSASYVDHRDPPHLTLLNLEQERTNHVRDLATILKKTEGKKG